ncbi:protein adenylyltransferase SelO [Agaribacterium haliotis]|uniref:protein adenylyltransferase SelO n=1 Tax=Agaribacterium haliotis TaxID=2013869 RepID=UPI000BB55BE5|nr:YdiU family protein [Agaribacterium haliotis]
MKQFIHSYRELDQAVFENCAIADWPEAKLLLWNNKLAQEIDLPEALRQQPKLQCDLLSGQTSLANSSSYALVYAGHQFGQFAGRLGDGRAHMLGEWPTSTGSLVDLQLKGSGPTPFSRGGDGFCALGPALREYLMSEALHALGVPSARSLGVVSTGATVERDGPTGGAIVCRVAQSHLRVGTFQWFAATEQHPVLAKLTHYALKRHYPEQAAGVKQQAGNSDSAAALALLDAVIDKQIQLLCHWMRIGFIHGVMNTDNCSIAGETIDFGPCAMLGSFNPSAVYSSIDRQGRYAFAQQPAMMNWNMARLAESLLPLIDTNVEAALDLARPLIEGIPARFDSAYYTMLANKFGFSDISAGQQNNPAELRSLIDTMLAAMAKHELDYTLSFRQLTKLLAGELDPKAQDQLEHYFSDSLHDWLGLHGSNLQECGERQLARQQGSEPGKEEHKHDSAVALMRANNPELIPRNYFVEQAIEQTLNQTTKTQGLNLIQDYLSAWQRPYDKQADQCELLQSKADFDQHYRTFCGT